MFGRKKKQGQLISSFIRQLCYPILWYIDTSLLLPEDVLEMAYDLANERTINTIKEYNLPVNIYTGTVLYKAAQVKGQSRYN